MRVTKEERGRMKTRWVLGWLAFAWIGLVPAAPLKAEAPWKSDAEADSKRDAETAAYDRGTAALDAGHWGDAITAFDDIARAGGRRADGALYWKAYAQSKAGQLPAAMDGIRSLQKNFPQSRWIKEAKALELELRQAAGQTPRPEQEPDEDLKLLALNSLMGADPERALPMLEKLLATTTSPKLRDHALFVLAQSGSPKAREVLARVAKGGSGPELQGKAVEYLGLFGGPESRQVLESLYASSADVEVKRRILRAYMVSGDKGRVLTAARGEKSPELRGEAIRQLGVMGALDELWEMYKIETAPEIRKTILHSLFVGGAAERIGELARGEKDPEIRREAIRTLGLMGADRTAASLSSLYKTETDVEARRAVLHAFFVQGNAKALVDIARAEKDPELRKEAVSALSRMNTKLATDYMLEILEK